MKHLVALLLAFLFACSPQWTKPSSLVDISPPGRRYICLDLPEAQLANAHEAVQLWDQALHKWIHIQALDGPDNNACYWWVHETDKANPDNDAALAWVTMVGGREIVMYKGHYEQATRGILLHEIGHALGAQHVQGTLMNRTYDPSLYRCPDRSTVIQVAAWNHVDLDLVSWCYF